MRFNEEEFDSYMSKQKERSKSLSQLETSEWEVLVKDDIEEFVGYNTTEVEVIITKYEKRCITKKIFYQLVFNVLHFMLKVEVKLVILVL